MVIVREEKRVNSPAIKYGDNIYNKTIVSQYSKTITHAIEN